MASHRVSLQMFLVAMVLTGCGSDSTVEPQSEESVDLDQSTKIDAAYCKISGVTIGSKYRDVVTAFDATDDDFSQISGGEQTPVKFFEGRGVFAVLIEDVVTAVGSETPDHGIANSLYPDASRDAVVSTLGETVGTSGDNLEVLSYWCRDFEPTGERVMMAIRVIRGRVESISIVSGDVD
ncbi:MAG: hypothetical protein AAFY56_07970 [Pseudomonadota bacterium]